MTRVHKVVVNDDLLRLLADVARAKVFYEILSPTIAVRAAMRS